MDKLMAGRNAYSRQYLDEHYPGWASSNEWASKKEHVHVFENEEIVVYYQHWRDRFDPESTEYVTRQILVNQIRIMYKLGLDNQNEGV
jgi:hypothetical protein